MRTKIKLIMAQALGIEIDDIDETSRLREDLGLDATELSAILTEINNILGSKIPEEELSDLSTVVDLLDLVEKYVPEEI